MQLFEPDTPEGFHYAGDFLRADDERVLMEAIAALSFDDFAMRGVVARRRVKFFGETYDGRPADPMPAFLDDVRAALAAWAGVRGGDFVMALINEYPPGATIGWHRDAPQYGITAGVSLLSACRLRLRPYVAPTAAGAAARPAPRRASHEIPLAPRSAYLMTGPSRTAYEHSIPAVPALRYSITFRTVR